MKKVIGITVLLVVVLLGTWMQDSSFLSLGNLQNIAKWTGLYGILAIGQAFVIITGGIDLSMGSIVGLIGSLLPMFLRIYGMPVWLAVLSVMGIAFGIGIMHGLLVTKLRLQPFVVTLCGLFFYRGLARYFTGDATQGFGTGFIGFKTLATGEFLGIPMPFVIMLVIAILAAILLNCTIYGRYLLALGRNEIATRFSGVHTDRIVIMAYVISATMAGVSGILFALDLNSIQPSGHGNFFELFAIAGCVLGGCSLRGGEGYIFGVIIGTMLVRVLYSSILFLGISTQLEYAVIGLMILSGVIADEILRRISLARRAARSQV